jgi:hypothetical protein
MRKSNPNELWSARDKRSTPTSTRAEKSRVGIQQHVFLDEVQMLDPQVAMQAAVTEAFKDCGMPIEESDIADFLDALLAHGYVVVRELDARQGK